VAQRQPNIVVIMADQLAPHFTGTYGHPVVRTPNMDRLASRGFRFDAAYCNAPLCAPSRFSFMSGQRVTRIAAYDNASEFPASIPTFAHYLREAGYRTCLSGKMHFVGPDQLHGFEERLTTDIYPADFAWTPDWELPDERIDKFYHNMDAVVEAGVAASTYQIDYDEEVGFFARRRIMDYAKEAIAPFAMVVSFIHPHDPYIARADWWNLYEHDEIDLPATPPALDPHSKRLMAGIEADIIQPSEAQIRIARHAYYANTSYFDSKVGEILKALEEAQCLDDTVVIVTADHGDMLGERGLWYKMNFFEPSVRVPLIMSGPGVANGTSAGPCSLVDLLPTMLEIAGHDKAPGMPIDGRSLWPTATGAGDTGDEAIAEYCAECASHPLFMIRRGRFKYIHCDIDPPMLFDVEADPQELINLAGDEAHAGIAAAFAAEVASRWDSERIREHVIATQRQRRAVHEAMQRGLVKHWDHQPMIDATQVYVRNHMDWNVAAARGRFPPHDGPRLGIERK
jgi:choline-sulfatase